MLCRLADLVEASARNGPGTRATWARCPGGERERRRTAARAAQARRRDAQARAGDLLRARRAGEVPRLHRRLRSSARADDAGRLAALAVPLLRGGRFRAKDSPMSAPTVIRAVRDGEVCQL